MNGKKNQIKIPGFKTTVQPVAIAGAHFHAEIKINKLWIGIFYSSNEMKNIKNYIESFT